MLSSVTEMWFLLEDVISFGIPDFHILYSLINDLPGV